MRDLSLKARLERRALERDSAPSFCSCGVPLRSFSRPSQKGRPFGLRALPRPSPGATRQLTPRPDTRSCRPAFAPSLPPRSPSSAWRSGLDFRWSRSTRRSATSSGSIDPSNAPERDRQQPRRNLGAALATHCVGRVRRPQSGSGSACRPATSEESVARGVQPPSQSDWTVGEVRFPGTTWNDSSERASIGLCSALGGGRLGRRPDAPGAAGLRRSDFRE
ncbi:hypothetical protein OCOJLMKI_0717 [Methylobacterium iners]|uniref:Uncharacterized protein n=1 Tax=Methylobacterium iners TaxID=418707 RepID=A0ABQ4RV99_9HYPH|nr:hypothetical protein OCOJLMKI_0717 [Methylobacterium iners]